MWKGDTKDTGIYVLLVFFSFLFGEPVTHLFRGIRMPWAGFVYGLVYVVVFFVLVWIISLVQAWKDPDVQEASRLGMNIIHFRKYRKLHDELMAICDKYGDDSPEANDKIKEMVKYIVRHPNEWRRFSEYIYQQSFEQLCDKFLGEEGPTERGEDEDTLGR